jgi:hypothetical protein
MRYGVWFGERNHLHVAWLPTHLSATAIDQCAGRLRGWALVRGVAIAGSTFVSPGPGATARVCLPLQRPCRPDPETGIGAEVLMGGPIAVVRDVPFSALTEHALHFADVLAPDGYRGAPEYQGAFHGTGLLTLPLFDRPTELPGELVFDGAPAMRRMLHSR